MLLLSIIHSFIVSVPELLLAGHNLIVATLDFLLVAQCASLLHKIIMTGRELLQLPWVRGGVTIAGMMSTFSHSNIHF